MTVPLPEGQIMMKQVIAIIDERTTMVCLDAGGQIRPVREPFNTLAGNYDVPPFHIRCRTLVAPWMPGFVNDQRKVANTEIQNRPLAQRRKGPGGEIGARIPPAARVRATAQVASRSVYSRVSTAVSNMRGTDDQARIPELVQAATTAVTFSDLPQPMQRLVRKHEST